MQSFLRSANFIESLLSVLCKNSVLQFLFKIKPRNRSVY